MRLFVGPIITAFLFRAGHMALLRSAMSLDFITINISLLRSEEYCLLRMPAGTPAVLS